MSSDVLIFPKDKISNSISSAIFIARTGEDQLHAGMVYDDCDTELKTILHLGWHKRLYNSPYSQKKGHFCSNGEFVIEFCWTVPNLDEDELDLVNTYCKLVAGSNRVNGIPYGFDVEGIEFDESGKICVADDAKGLTCSTFVLKVFEMAQIDLVDISTWKKRNGDKEWQEFILKNLENHRDFRNNPQKLKDYKNKIGQSIRVRPIDVYIAGTKSTYPASFDCIEKELQQQEALVKSKLSF